MRKKNSGGTEEQGNPSFKIRKLSWLKEIKN